MTCPKCIAEQGLAALRALNAGHPATLPLGGEVRPQGGRPLSHSTQAGIGEALLEQITKAGALCRQHGGRRAA
jgi:hypothetical protein